MFHPVYYAIFPISCLYIKRFTAININDRYLFDINDRNPFHGHVSRFAMLLALAISLLLLLLLSWLLYSHCYHRHCLTSRPSITCIQKIARQLFCCMYDDVAHIFIYSTRKGAFCQMPQYTEISHEMCKFLNDSVDRMCA